MKTIKIPETEREALGIALDIIRTRRELTQPQLAKLMGVGQATVHRILNGKADLRLVQIYKFLTLDEIAELFRALSDFENKRDTVKQQRETP